MTNRLRHLVVALLAGLTFAAEGTSLAEPPQSEFGTPRIVVPAPHDPRYAHLAWPKIVRTRDGTLVLAYSAGRIHGPGGEGCPAVSVSTNGGRTFTAPRILREFDRKTKYDNSANTALGIAEDGTVILLAMAFTDGVGNSIFGWRSADAGRSWTSTDTSNLADGKTGSVFGHVFPVPGKGVAVAGHFRPESKNRTEGIWIAYSKDDGKTWGRPQLVTEKKLFEPAIVLTSGRYVGLFRESKNSPFYWQAVSDDLGETWRLTRWPAEPSAHCRLPSPFVTVDPRDPDRLYALESQRHVPGNLPGRIYLWTADARQLKWTRVGLVVEFPETLEDRNDFSYPWMVHMNDDDWFLVFYCGKKVGPSSIYGMSLSIADPRRSKQRRAID